MNSISFLSKKKRECDEIWYSASQYKIASKVDGSEEYQSRTILMLMQYIDTLKLRYSELAQEYYLSVSEIEIEPRWMEDSYVCLMREYRKYEDSLCSSQELIGEQFCILEKLHDEYLRLIKMFESGEMINEQ